MCPRSDVLGQALVPARSRAKKANATVLREPDAVAKLLEHPRLVAAGDVAAVYRETQIIVQDSDLAALNKTAFERSAGHVALHGAGLSQL